VESANDKSAIEKNSASNSDPATSGAAGAAMPHKSRKRYELLDECREMIMGKLSSALTEAMTKVSDSLSTAAVDSKDDTEQAMLLEAAGVVRANQIEIEKRFKRSFNDTFEKRLFAKPGQENETPATEFDAASLSLVSEDDVNSRLAIDKLVNKARSKMSADELLGMRARLGALLDRDWFDEDKQPGSPADVLGALKSSLAELSPSPAIAAALLEAFEPYLTSNLNDVYLRVNQRLVANRILPKIRPMVKRSASQARTPREIAGEHAQAAIDAAGQFGSQQGGQAGLMDPMFMSAQAFEGLLDNLNRGIPSARQQAVRLLTDEQGFGFMDLPMPQVPQALLDAVNHIQNLTAQAPASGRQQLEGLKEQVDEKGSSLDKLTVDIVELVFDYIYSDHRLADPIKQQLLRLQVVAVKAALLDRSFFAKRQHPMRQVLDEITELGCDPDVDPTPDSALVKAVDGIVSDIVKNFDSDLGIFAESLERLSLVADQEEERRREWLTQKTEQTEKEELKVLALDDFRLELSARVDSATPEFMREFLYRWWCPVMVLSRVDSANLYDEEKAMSLAETLLWSVTNKASSEVPKLASLLPQLISGIMKGLNAVQCPQDEREVFFNELLKVHTKVIDATKVAAASPHRQIVAANALQRGVVMGADGKIKFNPPPRRDDQAHMAQTVSLHDATIESLFKGMRLDVLEENGETNRYKLAWISPAMKLFLLSRYPHEPLSVGRNDLATWLESGRVRPVDEDNIVGKALGAAAAGQTTKLPVAA
jgi:Protein of unknown function (DUF1631)